MIEIINSAYQVAKDSFIKVTYETETFIIEIYMYVFCCTVVIIVKQIEHNKTIIVFNSTFFWKLNSPEFASNINL